MKHIFIINPKAGMKDKSLEIEDFLRGYNKPIDYEIYITQSKGDAQVYVHDYLEEHKGHVRFYACGGDGTLYDVVNGAYGYKDVEIACLATGSGNDFVKNFHEIEKFQDIAKVIEGEPHQIDLLKVNNRYCINITNYGFDGEVTAAQINYKSKPHMTGPKAYKLAAVHCLLFKMNQPLKVTLDDEVVFDDKGLLCVIANGYCYGGGFHCAPKAKIDDGLIDVCVVKKVHKLQAANFMKIFRHGEHLENKKTKNLIIYKNCKKAVVESTEPVAYAIDGEVFREKKIEAIILPKALTFVVPK